MCVCNNLLLARPWIHDTLLWSPCSIVPLRAMSRALSPDHPADCVRATFLRLAQTQSFLIFKKALGRITSPRAPALRASRGAERLRLSEDLRNRSVATLESSDSRVLPLEGESGHPMAGAASVCLINWMPRANARRSRVLATAFGGSLSMSRARKPFRSSLFFDCSQPIGTRAFAHIPIS